MNYVEVKIDIVDYIVGFYNFVRLYLMLGYCLFVEYELFIVVVFVV